MDKIIVLFLFLFPTFSSAMDWNRLVDRLQNEPQEEIIRKLKSDEVALVSSDEVDFQIQRSVAEQSETLKNIMGDVETHRIIPLSNIKSQTLKEIIALLKSLKAHSPLKNKALLDALEKDVKITNPFELLVAINYLDVTPLLHLAARSIAQQQMRRNNFYIGEEFSKKVSATFGGYDRGQEILAFINRYYYLLSGSRLWEFNNYGYSIQDYLDYSPDSLKQPGFGKFSLPIKLDRLNLGSLGLISLAGIENVPNIKNVRYFSLHSNQLTEIPDLSVYMPQLKGLDLSNNQLTKIDETICQNLNLKELNVSKNQITSIPNCISQLKKLEELNLSGNELNIDLQQFTTLTGLKRLLLKNNDFTNITTQINDGTLTIDNLITIISQMPALKHLGLEGIALSRAKKEELQVATYEHRFEIVTEERHHGIVLE